MSMIDSEMASRRAEQSGAWLYLEEIMHRVLNDYSAMLSVVRLVSQKVSDEPSSQALDEVKFRLGAAAKAFRMLAPPADALLRNLDEDLEALCSALADSFFAKNGARLTLAAEPVSVNAHYSWKICLIVAELVINAFRHAFRLREGGSITVEMAFSAGSIRCAVSDDGSAVTTIVPGRGTAILDAIASEIGGTITRNHTVQGSAIVLQVPLRNATAH